MPQGDGVHGDIFSIIGSVGSKRYDYGFEIYNNYSTLKIDFKHTKELVSFLFFVECSEISII